MDPMQVTKDPRGTIPRIVTYTVGDPDGYDYTVGVFDHELMCFVHGAKCPHVDAVKLALAEKRVKT